MDAQTSRQADRGVQVRQSLWLNTLVVWVYHFLLPIPWSSGRNMYLSSVLQCGWRLIQIKCCGNPSELIYVPRPECWHHIPLVGVETFSRHFSSSIFNWILFGDLNLNQVPSISADWESGNEWCFRDVRSSPAFLRNVIWTRRRRASKRRNVTNLCWLATVKQYTQPSIREAMEPDLNDRVMSLFYHRELAVRKCVTDGESSSALSPDDKEKRKTRHSHSQVDQKHQERIVQPLGGHSSLY